VDLDPQTVERRDFPISRRGYDPAAVDAHLRALAAAVEELKRAAAAPGGGRASDSLAASAGSQVQAIVAAAEVAAAEIESEAQANAEQTRAQAQADAEKTRADAIAQAQAHVAAVGRATATLLARVESLDGETGALVDSIRAGGTRLAGDLAAVETNMGELYDAAAGRANAESGKASGPGADAGEGHEVVSAVAKERPEPHVPPRPDDVPAPPVASTAAPASSASPPAAALSASPPEPASSSPPGTLTPPIPSFPARGETSQPPAPPAQEPLELTPEPSSENGDAEGARLVALNMALNGDSREETDRYLAENYEIEDRAKLLDEVYAAIEG